MFSTEIGPVPPAYLYGTLGEAYVMVNYYLNIPFDYRYIETIKMGVI